MPTTDVVHSDVQSPVARENAVDKLCAERAR